jgi:type IV secretion system protein VirD4
MLSDDQKLSVRHLILKTVVFFILALMWFASFGAPYDPEIDKYAHSGVPNRLGSPYMWSKMFWEVLPWCLTLALIIQFLQAKYYKYSVPPRQSVYFVAVFDVLLFMMAQVMNNKVHGISLFLPLLLVPVSILIIRGISPKPNPTETKAISPYDFPPANTPEFDEQVARNELTVIPTKDISGTVLGTHGSANFLSDRKKEQATVKNPHRGLWLGGGFFHHKEGNLLTVAAPGSGKGAGIIIPNLLIPRDYSHSIVVFDPKGTNAAISAGFQQKQGQKVIILDPSGLQSLNSASHGIKSSCINPLDFIGSNIVKGCSQIANFLLPDNPNATDKIWNVEARDLIQGVLMHIMTYYLYRDQKNLVTLYKIFRNKTWDEILGEMADNAACEERIQETAKKIAEIRATSEKSFGSVVFSTGEAINWLKDPDIQDALRTSDFDPADFDKGKITLYLCIPIDSVEVYATWGRLVIGLLLHANARPSGREKARCYYLLDEFPTMGVFPEVIKALAFSREFKMRIWLFAQNLAQLDRIYTPNQRNEILGTCGVFQAFAVNEPITAQYVSQKLGMATRSFTSTGTSTQANPNSDDMSTSMSTSHTHIQRPLLYENEVEKETDIITFSEIGTYRLKKWFYWKKPSNKLTKKYYDLISVNADRNINYQHTQV